MAKQKQTKVEKVDCNDRLSPKYGERRLKMRGRTFEGTVIKKLHGRVTIQFESSTPKTIQQTGTQSAWYPRHEKATERGIHCGFTPRGNCGA